tara:strand:+ start:530 stop:829 length:300 start_codon:yes stop_codon:yes gene_type:complete
MSKSKRESEIKYQKQLDTDIKKFNVVFNSWTDDDKILYNRIHAYDKAQYAANQAIGFAIEEYSFDKQETIERYKSYIEKQEAAAAKKKEEKETVADGKS